jgi:hypothetical protein
VPGVLPITILAAGNSWSLNPPVLSSRPVLTYLNGVGVACRSFMRWLLARSDRCPFIADTRALTWCLYAMASVAAARKQLDRAARLWGPPKG